MIGGDRKENRQNHGKCNQQPGIKQMPKPYPMAMIWQKNVNRDITKRVRLRRCLHHLFEISA